MSKKKNAEFKSALELAQTDREPEVLAAANQANALFQSINSGALDAGSVIPWKQHCRLMRGSPA
ncbi:hypothetical protein GCM10022275_35030 [Tessaracoccus defluvii]